MEDRSQINAINFDSGSALVLAGPGSGKTYVLTHHIVKLVSSGIPPESILVITFTRRAAMEMKGRFFDLMPSAAGRVVFGTFHSVFYRFLKIFNPNTPSIISEQEKEKVLSRLSDDEEGYKEYKEIIHERHLMDFDDILDLFIELINSNDEACKMISSAFSNILIDEFQDINEEQYYAVKKLFSQRRVFAVGDQDQSIYGFRGASYDIMERFTNEFCNVSVMELGFNYRSAASIIDAATFVISKNQRRLRKNKLVCVKACEADGLKIRTGRNRRESLALFIGDLKDEIQKKRKVAVLTRTNREAYELRNLILGKRSNDIVFAMREFIYEDIRAYISYMMNRDADSFTRVINHPDRLIPSSVLSVSTDVDLLAKKYTGTYKGDRLSILANQFHAMEKMTVFSVFMYLKNIVGLEAHMKESYPEADDENIKELFEEIGNIAKEAKGVRDFYDRLEFAFGKNLTNGINDISNISVMTFHQSKGLEFDVVFLNDVVEGKVPLKAADDASDIEEERRLFYVAMTRAKERLYIYTIKNEESGSTLPSRFLNGLL